MSGDEKLIRRLIERAERDPRIWHPSAGCRTIDGTWCLPAMAVDLSGGRWADKVDDGLSEWVLADEADDPTEIVHIIHPHDRARRLLQVDLDLDDNLSLADLRGLIEH